MIFTVSNNLFHMQCISNFFLEEHYFVYTLYKNLVSSILFKFFFFFLFLYKILSIYLKQISKTCYNIFLGYIWSCFQVLLFRNK